MKWLRWIVGRNDQTGFDDIDVGAEVEAARRKQKAVRNARLIAETHTAEIEEVSNRLVAYAVRNHFGESFTLGMARRHGA